jgi:hypothetical protein
VRVGATPAGHLNTEFQVSDLPPEPSCTTWSIYVPILRLVGAAIVLEPPSVTVATEPRETSQLIVEPSVSVWLAMLASIVTVPVNVGLILVAYVAIEYVFTAFDHALADAPTVFDHELAERDTVFDQPFDARPTAFDHALAEATEICALLLAAVT